MVDGSTYVTNTFINTICRNEGLVLISPYIIILNYLYKNTLIKNRKTCVTDR